MQNAQALIKILLLFRMLTLLTGKIMPHPTALPNILKCLKDEGYEFVFISDLILKENYEIKHDGTQCKIENN